MDYIRLYGTKCSKCCHPITHSDWIRKAHDQVMMMMIMMMIKIISNFCDNAQQYQVFHLACFACDSCARQLSTGEEFGLVCDKVYFDTYRYVGSR